MESSHLPRLTAGELIGAKVLYAGELWTFLGFDAGDASLARNGRKVWVSPGLCKVVPSSTNDLPCDEGAGVLTMDDTRQNSATALVVRQEEPDLPAMVDALADMDYVNAGTRLVLGVDGAPIAADVHRANMAKEPIMCWSGGTENRLVPDPIKKPTKPEGWKAPDTAARLREQGWAE